MARDPKASSLYNSAKSAFARREAEGKAPSKFVASSSMDELGSLVESADYIRAELENKQRVEPVVDFSRPENFAKYGSAKEYYKTSVERIYKTYPYDGSKKEKVQWSLSSSYLDNYILENEYPRTNGFVLFNPSNGGVKTNIDSDPGTGDERITLANNPQYISVKGGPNKASLPIYDQNKNKNPDIKKPDHKANLYDTSNKRTKNITIDGTTGNTIEFWFRSDADLTTTRAIYDAWNGDGTNNTQIGSASYGRMLLETRFETTGTPSFVDSSLFHLTFQSGTTGAGRVPIFPLSVIGNPVNDVFNHFAVTIENSGIASPSNRGLRVKTYLNGTLIDNKLTGSAVSEVTGNPQGGINANIGAYRTYPTEDVKADAITRQPNISFEGAGNIHGSLDEVRLWKVARSEKQVGTNWFTQVGAGNNTDTSNTDLGFYFKFNEGITGNSNFDQTILDYSGRVSNGTYNNYSSTNRSTGSAIILASAAEREFKDPILYPTHPNVSSYKTDAMARGEEWDYRNPASLYNTLPSWINDEDPGTAKVLSQIMASYFDTLHLQIEEMPKIKTRRYLSSSVNNGVGPKPFPYASKLLTNAGFVAPEIFADTDIIAALTHRDDSREFERKLYDIKNYIYQNIYNNLNFINKSKGTTKSIRNLIRCFGVDEEIYKINMYADNAEYTLDNNFVDKTVRKTYADFNHIQRNNSTVYSYKNSGESDNSGFITGSNNTSTGFDRGMAMTVEAEAILPRKAENGTPNSENTYFGALTSSMFGMHSAKIIAGSDAQTVTTWDANDYANFQVYAVADTANQSEQHSKSVRFILKSYNSVLPELTSSFYFDQYKDTKWNFAVRVKPKGYPNVSSAITGAAGKTYDVEFEGYSTISDIVLNHFLATGSITNTAGLNFITQKKRLYAGAHRTNFTGSVREQSDVLVSSCRYWADNITSDEVKSHSIDPMSLGVQDAEKNAYLFVTKYEPAMQVPRSKTLVLNWEFDTVTGSDGSGQFLVKDSSYTINQDDKYQNWDRSVDLKNLLEANHDARGDFFEVSQTGSVSREYLQAFKQQLPENINDSNMVTVATTDDLAFTKNTLPVTFSFALEKSMYQTISEEMINFFYASKQASGLENLIGDPVNRYRMNYKSMEKVRSLFFNTIGNTPDLEKYLNYYKWLDNSISKMVQQLVPASAQLPGVTNVVEGHLLDRGGKYQTKFPTIESKLSDPEACMRGVNELVYDWEFGHAPTPVPAFATMTGILDDNTIPAALDAQTITITNTSGVTKIYKFFNGGGKSTGDLDSGNIVIQLNGVDEKEALVDDIRQAIEHANGHAGTIRVTRSGAVITLVQQALVGREGNTEITFSAGINTSTELSKTNFSGGSDGSQDDNCLWWNKKALRNEAGLSSGDAGVDSSRMMIHSASVQVLNRKFCSPIRFNIDRLALRQDLNKKQVVFAETPPGTGENLKFNTSTFSKPVDCDDTTKINPQFKFKPQFRVEGSVYQGQMVSPVVFYSSSTSNPNEHPTGYFKTSQHLQDYYSETKDIPMQGPFTEQHVGGYQYRHTGLNIGLASIRQEGWYTTTSSVGGETYFIVYSPSAISTGYPRATYSRDHIAKSYLNIKNIKNVNTKNNISAVANISFNSAASDTASAYAGKEIIIISTDGTLKKYKFLNGGSLKTGQLERNRVVVQINGLSNRDHIVGQLGRAINSNNGHEFKIDVKYNNTTNILTLIQTQMGQNGNTKIDARALVVANCFTHTMFSGGGGFGKANAGIQNDLASSIALGNYTHDYEIVQIPGRSINNQYFVENKGISTASYDTEKISGLFDRFIPQRGQNKYVFVSKFSAPGGPETMGAGYLDAESESFSVYNALPYRNLAVRSPLRTLLTKHSAFGGYDSVLGAGVAAAATMTGILDTSGIPAALDTQTIIIIDAAGLSKTYKFMNGGGKSTGDIDGGAVVVQLSGEDSKEGLVDNIEQAIESSNGHNGSIIVARSGAVITLTQGIIGLSGNTTITFSAGINTSTELSKTNFLGGLPRIASFHKTQRNGAKRLKINGEPDVGAHDGLGLDLVTGSTFDNAFIQHAIPQSDVQYAWITASALTTPFGYAQPNPANASMASTDITFVSQSQIGIWNDGGTRKFGINSYQVPESQFIAQDFSGMNKALKLVESQMAENTVQYESNITFAPLAAYQPQAPASVLNIGLLRSNGPAGNPTWAQVRQSYNPIVRDMKKNNRISLLRVTASQQLTSEGIEFFIFPKTLHSYTEPPVSSKYKPLRHNINVYNYNDTSGKGLFGDQFIIKSSYGNNLVYFTMTNDRGIKNFLTSMTKIMEFYEPNFVYPKQVYDDLKRIYLNSETGGFLLGSNPVKKANEISYREVIYPRESFTFLKKTRMRENYAEASGSSDFNRPLGKARTFWRDRSLDRLRSLGEARNSMSTLIVTASNASSSYEGVLDLSCWPLDANYPMVQIAPTGTNGVMGTTTTAGEGEGSLRLPTDDNSRTLNGELSWNNGVYNLYRVPVRGLGAGAAGTPAGATTLNNDQAITASLSYEYPNFAISGNDPNVAAGEYAIAHLNLIPEWTANLTSSRNPWFDSYDEYSNDIRRIGKDYTIIPEFRITDHMDYYLKEGFEATNKKFLDLIGSSLANTSSATSEKEVINSELFRVYSHSDFLKHFEVIQDDHVNSEITPEDRMYLPSRIRMTCKGLKKLLPYQGFYPALRTVQLGQMLSSSYGSSLTGSYDTKTKSALGAIDNEQATQQLESLIQPFFAPGIMFNTIKSGIAVDWPVITGSIESKDPTPSEQGTESVYGYRAGGLCNFNPDWRLPFEALLSPNKYLPIPLENQNEDLADRPSAEIYHIWPNYPTASLAQSSHARRFTPRSGEEHRNWYDFANYTRPSPNVVFTGQDYDEKYNLAMSNFLAETVEFFLEENKLSSFVSKPEKEFKPMHSGAVYQMDVILRKTSYFKMYEGPDRLFLNMTYNSGTDAQYTSSVGCRGMHYGPYFASNGATTNAMQTKQELILKQLSDPSPAPYTPPYFYGDSVARISFRPHRLREMNPNGEPEIFTLSEIFSSAEIETEYFNKNQNSNGVFQYKVEKDPITGQTLPYVNNLAKDTPSYRNQMRVDSSVNLFERFGEKYVSYEPVVDEEGEVKYIPNNIEPPKDSDTSMDRWVVETKFECPTLNFYDSNYDPSIPAGLRPSITNNERNATNGMWRTYGADPTPGHGIYLEMRESNPQITGKTDGSSPAPGSEGRASTNPETGGSETRGGATRTITTEDGTITIPTTGSLMDICGFEKQQEVVGKVASSKTISEAIVAIPMNPDGTFVSISLDSFNKQRKNLVNHGVAVKAGDFAGVEKDISKTSISSMIQKMKKYVIPPHLDFLNNKTTRDQMGAFVMYIFEFNHVLSKNDLSLIWQNMMPDISVTAQKQEVSIEHPVLTGELDFFGIDSSTLIKGNASYLQQNTKLFSDEMRWMVFKVKQRAKNNYFDTSITKKGQGFGFNLDNADKNYNLPAGFENQSAYGYNWPYDFFSLVELAKVESGVKFKPKKLKLPEEEKIETATSDKPEIVTDLDDALKIGKGLTIIETTDTGGQLGVDTLKLTKEAEAGEIEEW